jgi:transcription initiation factor IIE alpha subunit
MTDEGLRCPDCGELLEGDAGEVPVSVEDGVIRVPFDCPECDAPLAITVESALPEALGVDLTVERRDAGEGPR